MQEKFKNLKHTPDKNLEKIISEMPVGDTVVTVADALKLLGDPSRLEIFWLLCHVEECVADIATLVDMNVSAVSHHLRLLRNSGLVVTDRQGKEIFYRAADTDLVKELHRSIEMIAKITCPT